MKISKLNIVEAVTCTLASFGAAAVLLGGGACFGGLAATGIIKAGEFLSSQRSTYKKMMF